MSQPEPCCPICGREYERHPFIGVLTCFLHPSEEERGWASGLKGPIRDFRFVQVRDV